MVRANVEMDSEVYLCIVYLCIVYHSGGAPIEVKENALRSFPILSWGLHSGSMPAEGRGGGLKSLPAFPQVVCSDGMPS